MRSTRSLLACLCMMAACGDEPDASSLRSICSAECKMYERCGSLERRSINGETLSLERCERDCNERARNNPAPASGCEVEWSSDEIEACVAGYELLSCDDVARGNVVPNACTQRCS